MKYNFRQTNTVRSFILLLTVCALLWAVICCVTLHEKRHVSERVADAAAALSVPSRGEAQRALELMRKAQDEEKSLYGAPSLTELSYIPNISIGIDLEALRADLRNLDLLNEDEQKVIDATYVSAYKQVLVIKLPIGYNGASFGAIFLGDKITSIQTVRHEYGHTRQLREMGIYLYIVDVAIPSIIGNLLDREGKLLYDYYGSYWEAGADELGGVIRSVKNEKWPNGADSSIWKLCSMID